MDNKAKSQVNSGSIALILTLLGAKRAVQSGLGYPELRLSTSMYKKASDSRHWLNKKHQLILADLTI